MHSFAAPPQAVSSRSKYRDPDDVKGNNIMHDRRIIRGNTHAATIMPQQDTVAQIEKQRMAQSRRLMRANKTRKRGGTPDAMAGLRHLNIQTDSYLEELTERTVEFEADTHADFLVDRPPSPLFMPAKIGVDVETEIQAGDLFNFEAEAEPILEVLVGKTLEQAMMDVLEEEELESLMRHQREFEKKRDVEMQKVQRMESEEKRRSDEVQRRKEQENVQRQVDLVSMQKVISRSIAVNHVSSLKNRVLGQLLDAGVFSSSVEQGVESDFMPQLSKLTTDALHESIKNTQRLQEVMQSVNANSLATHGRKLDAERRRLNVIDDAVREARKEIEEQKMIKKVDMERVAREQTRMQKWQGKIPKPPKITDYEVASFDDGESVVLLTTSEKKIIKEFAEDTLKEELQAMMASLKTEIGERVVCNIATDLEFVPPEDADPNVMWGSKITKVRVFRTNCYSIEILGARQLRDHPCDSYVVIKDVEGLVGDERRTEICKQSTEPEWGYSGKIPGTYKLAAMAFEVRNPNLNDEGKEELLLKCQLPVDMLYKACAEDPHAKEVDLDVWLEASEEDKRAMPDASKGQLHVRVHANFAIPIMLPEVRIPLPSKFQIGLAWEYIHPERHVDLDASLVGLSKDEKIIDQVHYDKLRGFHTSHGDAVVHSGDNRTGEGDGDDETISIDLDLLPESVVNLAVCINAYHEEHLDTCIKFAYLRLIVDGTTHGFFSMGEGYIPHCTGLFFGSAMRTDDGWKFVTTAVEANGSKVVDSMPKVLAYGKSKLGW